MSFQFTAPGAGNTNPPPAFGATTTTAKTSTAPSLSFGTSGGGDAGKPSGIQFGITGGVAPAAAKPFGSSLGATTTATAPAPGNLSMSFATQATSMPQFSLATTGTTTSASAAPSFSFGLSTTSAAPPATTTTNVNLLSSQQKTTVSQPISLTTTTSTTQAPTTQQLGGINFVELEEHLNEWTYKLEEQEKEFMNQATQVNAWDKVLISNSEKILQLTDSVEKVKNQQKSLEHELEFIGAQHQELEDSIAPLCEELSKMPQVDNERVQTYLLAENLDSQIKQMSEDLKEIIEHLNEVNKVYDPNDPIIQIGKILNAHMNSLQWIEQSTNHISTKLDELNNLQDSIRKEYERPHRLNYL